MAETNRVQRWREGKRQEGLKAVTVWLTTEEELRLKDLALQGHCSPSALVQQALAQFAPHTPPGISTATDTSQIRELIRGELAAMQAGAASVTDTVTDIVTVTLARDLPALVRNLVEGLALEALGLPVTDTNSNVTETEAPGVQDKAPRGSTPPPRQFKLTPRQVKSLRTKRQQGAPVKALMEEYGLSRASVYRYLE